MNKVTALATLLLAMLAALAAAEPAELKLAAVFSDHIVLQRDKAVPVLYSHPAVEKITLWGFWEGQQWMPPAALWRKGWTIKPIAEAWMNLVKTQ